MSSVGRDMLGLLAAGLAVSIISAWVAASYFAVDVPGSLIFPGDDGWCQKDGEAIGTHCFGDVAQFLTLGPTMDPQGSNPFIRNYPPLNRLGFFVFQLIGASTTQILALALYVALSAVCLLVPALWVVRHRSWAEKLVVVALIGVATFPFLATIDRGNNLAFAVPLLFGLVLALQRMRFGWAVAAVIVGSQIKPQIGLLAVAFLVLRHIRSFSWAVLGSLGLFLASFAIFWVLPGGLKPLQEFRDFLFYVQLYDQYQPLTQTYPLNISFVHLLGLLWEGSGVGIASTEGLQWAVYASVAVSLVFIAWRGARLGIAVWFPALLMGVLLTPNPVFAYYLIGALIAVTFFFRSPFVQQIVATSGVIRWLLVAAVVTSLTPLLIPAGWTEAPVPTVGEGVVVTILPRVASALWFAYLIVVAASAARGATKQAVVDKPSP